VYAPFLATLRSAFSFREISAAQFRGGVKAVAASSGGVAFVHFPAVKQLGETQGAPFGCVVHCAADGEACTIAGAYCYDHADPAGTSAPTPGLRRILERFGVNPTGVNVAPAASRAGGDLARALMRIVILDPTASETVDSEDNTIGSFFARKASASLFS
jgi:hypothetical protein